MNNRKSQVIATALQFCKQFPHPCPEAVLYGYSKLLLMDEIQLKALLSEEDMKDLDEVYKWFSNNKLDLKLIKSGLFLLVSLMQNTSDSVEKGDAFKEFLDSDTTTESKAVLDKILQEAFIPIAEVFHEGNNMDDVFRFENHLKEVISQKEAEAQKTEKENTKTDAADTESEVEGKTDQEEDKPEIKPFSFGKQDEAKKNDERPAYAGNGSGSEKADSEPKTVTETHDAGVVQNTESGDTAHSLQNLSVKYRNLYSSLLEVVKGQEQAVLKFIQGYNQGELLKESERGKHPRSYFFFFGPPGVGKTLLAETAASAVNLPSKVFNMSEYATQQSHEELIGIARMYNNAREGSLVKFVRENPESVLIFDEVEKAHINVIRLFLQILGSGSLQNVFKETDTNFQDTIIIFTSNVGKELYADRSENLSLLPEKVLIDIIQKEKNSFGEPALPLELCSRIASGNTVMFNHLSIRHLVDIVNSNLEKVVMGMEKEYGVKISYSKYLPLLFLYNRGGDIDARVATGQSGKFLKNELFELIRQMENRPGFEEVKSISLDIEWEDMDPDLNHLFKIENKANVLFFTSEQYDVSEYLTTDRYTVTRAGTLEEARKELQKDITAIYIDPFYGEGVGNETILSISDYNTDGIRLFHELVGNGASLPVYLLETDREISEVDRRTFLQEGAAGSTALHMDRLSSFKREFVQTLEELYMEKESQEFSQRGWVIDFNTKQEIEEDNGFVKILFYDLKKRMAVDVESRGSILSDAQRPNVRFADVIGAENAKEELQYFVKYLQNPKQFLVNGGRPPKGVLLYGPPGTGKTMLAKAMAGESDVTFLQTSASEFKNKYVGESEANIRKIFQKAKKYAPSIIFIDEIDAIGKKRTGSETTATTESMLNALLTEMDGFSSNDSSKPVFVLAATNFGVGEEKDGISGLDDALIRRFDNKIYVDLPKENERKKYLDVLLAKNKITTVSAETTQSIAERTTGQSLAILQNVFNLAQRAAAKQERPMTDGDLLTALEEYNYGEKKEHSPEYYKSVAIHETGHAYVSYISGDKPSYITIESRGDFGGYMAHANEEDKTGYTKEELLGKIRTALAGRAAELVFFDKDQALNTGASSDLQNASYWAFRIVCRLGMEEGQFFVMSREEVLKSSLAPIYVEKVNSILKEEMNKTLEIIAGAKEKIQAIADVLVKENRLTGKQFEDLMENES